MRSFILISLVLAVVALALWVPSLIPTAVLAIVGWIAVSAIIVGIVAFCVMSVLAAGMAS